MQVLEQYGCPKFVSNGMNSLELGVVSYQKAFKKWDADNMYRQTEILNALGIKK